MNRVQAKPLAPTFNAADPFDFSDFWASVLATPSTDKVAFVAVNLLDILFTTILINSGSFYESNPIANMVLQSWGFEGMALFKLIIILFVMLIANVIANRKLGVSRAVLRLGTLIVGSVVVYSGFLMYQHL